jgi:hypothetical protein
MKRRITHGGGLAAVVAGVVVVGSGCLTRPVEHANPTASTNFTTVVHNEAVDKLDLLFMIDNSASMGDKQTLLAQAVPDMINRLVAPQCLDDKGNPIPGQTANPEGACAQGTKEFPPVHDMHIGIVSSSLGGRGGDQCPANATNQANPSLNAHNDDRGELINRSGANETTVADAPGNFLGWFPNVMANGGKMPPAVPITDAAKLNSDFQGMIQGVHEHGCGFEAQNEAWYRFLVQPDPFDTIQVANNHASLNGIDATILKQRADFLRPDSLVAVIVVTDENEEVADPLAISKQGWAFETGTFPGSPTGSAPQGTVECTKQDPGAIATTGPNDPSCTSCAFVSPYDANRCPPVGMGQKGYLDQTNDSLNVRFFNQKIRFGLFAGYPISRYVRGLSNDTVPDSAHEHDGSSRYVGDDPANANCTNPLYATNLPTDPGADLCKLTRGPRTKDLVYYAAIAGVPHQLLQQDPTNADSPQKDTLTDADWLKITGNDPEHYDFTGADFHMIESEIPRVPSAGWGINGGYPPGVVNALNVPTCPPTSADNCDPINGREWETKQSDLQYACVFDLPQTKDCSTMAFAGACDCTNGQTSQNTPLCQGGGGTHSQIQIKGKAYPSVRELVIAHQMKAQGIVSSLCPIHVTEKTPGDPLFGYRPAVKAIVDRLKNSLSNQCLPQKLQPDQCGNVPCLILVTLPAAMPGDKTQCKHPGAACNLPGLSGPGSAFFPQDVLDKFCDAQEAAYKPNSGDIDPATLPVCALNQLSQLPAGANTSQCPAPASPSDFDPNGSCSMSAEPGWCYVEGVAAKGCPQAILFTNGEPPHGATVNLQCIEQAPTVIPDAGGGG